MGEAPVIHGPAGLGPASGGAPPTPKVAPDASKPTTDSGKTAPTASVLGAVSDGKPPPKPTPPKTNPDGSLVDDLTPPTEPDFSHLNMIEGVSMAVVCLLIIAAAWVAFCF